MKQAVPDLLVDAKALYPPLSGVGYFTLGLLEAYGRLPDHFPIKLLDFRFFLKRRSEEGYLASLAARLGASLEFRRRPFPSAVYARLRRLGLRPPAPIDLFRSSRRTVYFFPNFVGEPLLHSRCVPIIHDFGFLHDPDRLQERDHLFLKRYLPRTLNRASQVVVNSNATKRELLDAYGIPSEKITVIYPAVDHAAFRPEIPEERRLAVRKKYGLDGPFLFSLSTLEPRKNFAGLVEAYARLPENVKKRMALAIAGGRGWKSEDVFAALRRLGLENRIKFLGYIAEDDRAPLMQEAELFVLPSLHEGFGMPVLEAMACGTPVVTSARGALPEVGGEAVVYVDPLLPDAIAAGILSILENPNFREGLVTAGRIRAESFQWSASAHLLANVFKRAAGSA